MAEIQTVKMTFEEFAQRVGPGGLEAVSDSLMDKFLSGTGVPSLGEMEQAGIRFPTLDETAAEKNALAASKAPDSEEQEWIEEMRRDYNL